MAVRQRQTALTLLTVVIAAQFNMGYAQETTPEPTVPAIKSVFPEDSCAPPCWFGITPGESTSADVERMFEDNAQLFEWRCYQCQSQADALIVDTFFRFRWRTYTRNDTPIIPGGTSNSQARSEIVIDEEGVVELIYTRANREITLDETLAALGNADDAYLVPMSHMDDFGASAFALVLDYIEQRLKLLLITYPQPTCKASSVLEDFHVDELYYYSIDAATRPFPVDPLNPEESVHYPILVVPEWKGRQIRSDAWDRWIGGEGYERCEDFFDSLPDTYVVPTLPWPSPTLTPMPTQNE